MMYPIASIAVCVLLFSSSNVNAFNFNFKSATGIAKTAFSFINDGPVKTIISKGIGATGLKLPPLLPSVAIGAVGAALPPIINGLRSGDSLYTLLVPVFDNIRGRIGRVPFLNFIIKRQLFKNELVFKDVKMPEMKDINERLEDFLSLTGTSQISIVAYLVRSASAIGKIAGMPKTNDAFDKLFADYVDYAIKSSKSVTWQRNLEEPTALPEGYLHFGNQDNIANIPYFFLNNPFFTASLRDHPDGGFEIDPYGESGATFFSRMLEPLEESVVRVSARLDKDMNLVSTKLYTGSTIKKRKEITGAAADKYTTQRIASVLLFQAVYYAQCVHATMHVFHLLMTTALIEATDGTSLEAWARPHVQNIYLKYVEVEKLLFSETGVLSSNGDASFHSTDRAKTLAVNREILCEWGACNTAQEFADKFLFKNIPKGIKNANVASEFKKYVELMGEYGTELAAAVAKDGEALESGINRKLSEFMRSTGKGVSSVDNLKTWAELLAVTGVMHGSTISMTRLSLTPSILAEANPETDTFGKGEASIFQTSIGTILGALEDFRVFSSTLPSSVSFNVNRVLTKYDAKSSLIKAEYFNKITENQEEFKNFGWILTDHGPNFVDGKQMTISTYI